MSDTATENYYDILQLSPSAEQLVITKVYRLLAAYYHPDNQQTGNEEKFKRVLKAYEVLADPASRSRYNQELFGRVTLNSSLDDEARPRVRRPAVDFRARYGNGAAATASQDGNITERQLRKLMLLALYDVRRNSPGDPQLSLLVLTELLGCAVRDLEFSNWYLKEKGYIKITESADFSITIAGVDYVESQLLNQETEKQLLSLPEGRS
jgi:molecular chaperone DnaJ